MTPIRIAHLRFSQGEPVPKCEPFDRVVTAIWSYDYSNFVLTYAATVYKKKDGKDFWTRKEHRLNTEKRFKEHPLRIQFKFEKTLPPEISNTAMDWFIARRLVFTFGAYNKTELDVRRIHGEIVVDPDFNQRHFPWYENDTSLGYNIHYPYGCETIKEIKKEVERMEKDARHCWKLALLTGFIAGSCVIFSFIY